MKKMISLLFLLFVTGLIFWSFFFHLGKMPFRIWDESRLITSAYEMNHNHLYLTPTIENFPDMWNTKPPLMIWAEVLSIKTFGFREWSARLPAAACGMLTVLLVSGFIGKLIPERWTWLMPVIVLCTSMGFIGYHTTRAGEYDAMLTFFITAYLLSFFVYTEAIGNSRNKYLLLFFAFLILACLTKGIAGMLFTPFLFLYLLLRKQLVATLANRYTYLGAMSLVLFVIGYYLLREKYNPGYIQAVVENELGARFNAPIQGAQATPWHMYFDAIRAEQFSTWFWALPLSLVLICFLEKGKVFRLAVFCWLCVLGFIGIISVSATKYEWYDLPAFPLLAILVSIVIFQLSGIAGTLFLVNRKLAAGILITVFSIQPLWECFNYIYWQSDDLSKDNFYAPSYYFRKALYGERDLSGYIYLSCIYNIQWRLYIKMLDDKGIIVEDDDCKQGYSKFKAGDKLIANQAEVKEEIEKKYNYKLIEDFYGVKSYEIISPK